MTLPVPHVNPNSGGSSSTQNNMIDAINSLPRGYMDDAIDWNTNVTLSTVATDFAGTAASAVTFTLTETRRVKITVQARFVPNGAAATHGNYSVQVGYNTGTAINLGSVTKSALRALIDINSTQTGDNGSSAQVAWSVPLLTAGTYTVYAVARREQGGDPADYATGWHTLVEDIGAS